MLLEIRNKGSLSRDAIEMLGSTDKRKDPKKEGYFGSGIKLAAIAGLRLGLDIVISSVDEFGPYRVRWHVPPSSMHKEEGSRRVHLSYENVVKDDSVRARIPIIGFKKTKIIDIPWLFTDGAGPEWSSAIGSDTNAAYKPTKEYVSNARDEDSDFEYNIIPRSEMRFAEEGEVLVYIVATQEVRELFDSNYSARYFKFLAHTTSYDVPACGRIYEKSEKAKTRLFIRGYLAGCSSSSAMSSVWDYSLEDVGNNLLSEGRVIKNMSLYLSQLAVLLFSVTDKTMVRTLFDCLIAGKANFEEQAVCRLGKFSDAVKDVWCDVITEHYQTEKVCLSSGNVAVDEDARQIRKHAIATELSPGLKKLFEQLGYPTAWDLMPKQDELVVVEWDNLSANSQRRFLNCWRVFVTFFPQRASTPIGFYYAPNREAYEGHLGAAEIGQDVEPRIWFALKGWDQLPSDYWLIGTMIHEGRHVETQAKDIERAFVEGAEHDILILLMRILDRKTLPDGFPGDRTIPPLGKASSLHPIFIEDLLEVDVDDIDDIDEVD